MEQKIISPIRTMNFIVKKLSMILCLIISIFFMQPSLSAQMKPGNMNPPVNSKDSVNGITIHQEISFNASPERLYKVLLSSSEFSASTKKSFENFTATSATIDPVAGGTFTLFDGHIIGRILELVPNQRIVEAWRVVDWPAGIYSIAKFELIPEGSGTKIIFDHVGFPQGLKEHLASGWQEHYWGALTKYLQ
jgi:activator of HSP90 ATPase